MTANNANKFNRGLTLIEILISIAIIALLGTTVLLSFSGYRQRQVLESSARSLAATLRDANKKAVNQDQGKEWGVHFERAISGRDFYAVFNGPVYLTPVQLVYLPPTLRFIDPASGFKEIIFEKLTGLPSLATNIVVALTSNVAIFQTIIVDGVGKIQY
ncbi:MAG: hypothetical protein A3I24_04045 [Candidatus Harrisonbacteria bacterium RIFCSPLOWO2_02_FULL_41_13b]|uniref:General secretion pathway GspH domain-containing protein n=1 Tax=Candidatus Harrisonbacteria bacterium RIFCSPLOWO2_02_FULL_41_13b TaxID=1798409 RepID=A0A1G1ZQ63_9BACT|nr:MAG: hypothetical protein A3J53_00255 [Candidatus Harrisonbacteria bacterium RIFCSPHIGHO2_02_FULL_40_20]OGY66833.1 MAG: hypothetical protein A3I24_04045 [Candidatus Harrisonbacteria bacterium RIFCSPLOWO2_02_FULL_41_13b]